MYVTGSQAIAVLCKQHGFGTFVHVTLAVASNAHIIAVTVPAAGHCLADSAWRLYR